MSGKLGEPTGTAPRNNAITLIGWIYIAFGILAAFGGLVGVLMSLLMPIPHFVSLIAAVQLIAGSAMIAGGKAFLRLRAWARTLLETLAWLGLLYNLASGALWIWFLMPMFRATSRDAWMLPVMTAIGLLTNIAFCASLVYIISVLRGSSIRSAIASANV
ncbi:MAG TPA: hypothetical protein VII32_01985 [Thermoanaerobaculia bacterium]